MKNKSTKKERQQILNKMLQDELERLRRLIFPYGRRELIEYPIIIKEEKINDYAGKYEFIDNQHVISISNITIDRYTNFIKSYYRTKYYTKLDALRWIKQTVHHEIIHALTYERYTDISDIPEIGHDASPIFNSILCWTGGVSHHDCMRAFRKSEICNRTMQCLNFKELNKYLIHLIVEYNHIAMDYKQKWNGLSYISNGFSFASRKANLVPSISSGDIMIGKDAGKIKRIVAQCNKFEIGCCISPTILKDMLNKKVYDVVNFEYHKLNKQYVINAQNVKTIEIANTMTI
jgi:hypothetical protein